MRGVCLHEFLLLMSRKCVHERSQLFESIKVSAGRLINGLSDVGLDVLVDWQEKFSIGKQRIRGGFVASIGRATTRRIGRATGGPVLGFVVVVLFVAGGRAW